MCLSTTSYTRGSLPAQAPQEAPQGHTPCSDPGRLQSHPCPSAWESWPRVAGARRGLFAAQRWVGITPVCAAGARQQRPESWQCWRVQGRVSCAATSSRLLLS